MVVDSWRGNWWLSDSETAAVAGTLHRLDDGRLRLELVGRLTPTDDEFMVLGETLNGPLTLLKCRVSRTTRGRIDVQDVTAGQYVHGLHLTSPDERRFLSTTVRFEYLLGWMGDRSTFGLNVKEEAGQWTGEQTASTTPGPDLTVTCGDFGYKFAVVFNQFKYEARGRASELELSTKEWCELTITSKTPLPYNGFERQVKAMMDLLTLAAHAPAGVLHQKLCYKTTNEQLLAHGVDEDTAELYARQIHQPIPGNDETRRVEYLFTLDDVDLADVLPRWIAPSRTNMACLRHAFRAAVRPRGLHPVTIDDLGDCSRGNAQGAISRSHRAPA